MKKHQSRGVFTLTSIILLWSFALLSPAEPADSWNGTVSFSQVETGFGITSSVWKIEGSFQNNTGPVIHSSSYNEKYRTDSTVNNCSATGTGILEVTIDESNKTYDIIIKGVPECVGTTVVNGVSSVFTIPGGDTVFLISKRPLGNNLSKLAGNFSIKSGPGVRGSGQTLTFKWDLTKSQ